MSLVEIMVYGTLLMTILVAMASFLSTSQGYASQTQAYAYAQREAATLVRFITRDLNNSVAHWVVQGNSPQGYIIFLSADPPQNAGPIQFDPINGTLIWQKWLCYYQSPASQSVVRCEIPLTPPTSNLAAQPAPISLLPDFLAAPAAQQRTVAHQVASFVVGIQSPTTFDFTVTTSYVAAVATASEQAKVANVTLGSRVTVLNSQ